MAKEGTAIVRYLGEPDEHFDVTKEAKWTIRQGTGLDIPALSRLPHTATALRSIETSFNSEAGFLRLVVRADEIIGVGCGGRQPDHNLTSRGYDGEIKLIYVLPEWRHQRIGADLMGSVAPELAALGMSEATSWAAHDDAGACRFYTRHGGRIVAERHRAVGNKLTLDYAYAWTQLSELCGPLRSP